MYEELKYANSTAKHKVSSKSNMQGISFNDNRAEYIIQRKLNNLTSGKDSSNVVQRVVTSLQNPDPRTKATNPVVYETDLDPSIFFFTEADALNHEFKIINNKSKLKIKSGRVPTIYTYFQSSMGNKISNNLQGPHTVADAPMDKAIHDIVPEELDKTFGEQVPTFDKVEPILDDELKGSTVQDQANKKNRYKNEYGQVTSSYDKIKALRESKRRIAVKRHLLRRGVNMHPYAAYLWNIQDPAKNVSNYSAYMAGKGERKDMKTKDAIDDGYTSFFKSGSQAQKDRLKIFFDMRTKLLNKRIKKIKKKK